MDAQDALYTFFFSSPFSTKLVLRPWCWTWHRWEASESLQRPSKQRNCKYHSLLKKNSSFCQPCFFYLLWFQLFVISRTLSQKKKKYIKALMHPSTPKRVLHIKQNGLGGSARNFSGEPLAPFEQWSESRARAWPHQTHLLPFPDSITELSNQHRAKRSSLSHHKLPLPTPWSINKYLNLTA